MNVRNALRKVLSALARKLAQQSFSYPVPQRMSLGHLKSMLNDFLDESSGGLRPLAVSTALLRTLGEAFSLFTEVTSQGLNESDAATGTPGDIMCYKQEVLSLVVEVKDTELTLTQAEASSFKAKQSRQDLSNLLFIVPRLSQKDLHAIEALVNTDWASGLNVYTLDLDTLANAVFPLPDERWRIHFARDVGVELDERQNQPARKHWFQLLAGEKH